MAASQKISELTTAGPLTGAELVPIVQNSGTLQTTVSVVAAFAIVSLLPIVSSNTAAITSINAVTSSLEVRVTLLEAALSAIGDVSAIAGVVSAVAVLQTDVAALEIRMTDVSAATSVNAAAISVNSAAITSINAAITSINAVVSVNAAAITSTNAVVSTKANRNGDFLTNVQYIDFNTTTSYAPAPGRLTWDIPSGTLDLGLTGTVNLLVGQRTVAQIYNNTGATLLKDKAVRVTGAQGQRLTGALAQADSDADSLTIFGVMLETVSVNRSGYVATDGLVRNFNTGSFSDGDILYLSPVSAGGLTITKPVAPQHLVQVGYVVNGGSVGAGSIYIKVQNGYELGELHDVKVSASTSLADGEVLVYNVSAQVWTNSPALINAQASISALNIQLAAVSALASVNAAAITSVNNVVSALEIRVSAVSAAAGPLSAAITSVNNVVSALQVQVNAVSVSVEQRVLRAGDTMTGALTITTSADQQGLTVAGRATFNALVSISAGTYTGLQNYQDNTLQRATFRDYALLLVARGSVSATTTLDLLDGNFFQARAAGSTTFVFANPPVSAVGTGGAAGGFVLELQNGGAATVTWPTTVRWPGGTAPTLTASGFDVFVFITDDAGANWRGVQSMRDSK